MNAPTPELSPKHTVSLVEDRCEVHFSISGFWSLDIFKSFLDDVNAAALPLMKARKPIYALGDFGGFVPQNQETGEAIRDHLLAAQKYGLKRLAVVAGSALVKLQYRRLSRGVEVEFFDTEGDAIEWLRKDRP